MKTAALLILTALLAPVAFLLACGARRWDWPYVARAALALVLLILGVHVGAAW